MPKRARLSAALPVLAAVAAIAAPATAFADAARQLFESVEGEWTGPGEVVAGKYKGTKFTCNFTGATPDGKVGMSLTGGCRVGLFTQKMSASVEREGRGYTGVFMDGAEGKGLDIVSGKVSGRKVVLGLNRNQLEGAMLARLPDDNTLHVTVSVRVNEELVPVIGMNLKRSEPRAVGAVAR